MVSQITDGLHSRTRRRDMIHRPQPALQHLQKRGVVIHKKDMFPHDERCIPLEQRSKIRGEGFDIKGAGNFFRDHARGDDARDLLHLFVIPHEAHQLLRLAAHIPQISQEIPGIIDKFPREEHKNIRVALLRLNLHSNRFDNDSYDLQLLQKSHQPVDHQGWALVDNQNFSFHIHTS